MLSAVFAVVVCLCVYVSVCVSVCHTPVLCHSHTVISTPLYTEWFTFLVQAYPRDHSKEADKWLLLLLDVCRLQQYQHCPLLISRCQGRSDGGGYIGIYAPQNQPTLQIFMWLLVVFFSLTQDKFDINRRSLPGNYTLWAVQYVDFYRTTLC